VPMVIMGNKWDLETERKFGAEEITKLGEDCKGFGVSETGYLTSAKTGRQVDDAFLKLAEMALAPSGPQKLPDDWHLMDPKEIHDIGAVIDHIIADFAEQFGGIDNATPFIRQQLRSAKLDLNHPTEDAIKRFVEKLYWVEEAYKSEAVARESKIKRLSLLKALK
jgi:hypothetical protein